MGLYDKLVKLAYEKPELRPQLHHLIKVATFERDTAQLGLGAVVEAYYGSGISTTAERYLKTAKGWVVVDNFVEMGRLLYGGAGKKADMKKLSEAYAMEQAILHSSGVKVREKVNHPIELNALPIGAKVLSTLVGSETMVRGKDSNWYHTLDWEPNTSFLSPQDIKTLRSRGVRPEHFEGTIKNGALQLLSL